MKRIILCISIALTSIALYSQEENIGWSVYDLQSNGSCQNRIYLFEDGTIGATWSQSHLFYSSFTDRGTGYNYFDGNTWQQWPEERIESMRTGWPSYAPFGETGEVVVAHLSSADTVGLLFNKRIIKGSGDWIESLFTGPIGHESLIWPRMVTGGPNHDHIYLIALTAPVANGGDPYLGLNGALLYSRTTDGGNTWEIQNQLLPGMDSTEYNGFSEDSYAFAEPRDNIVAFVVGSYETDMFLMKSIDEGQTFEKTIIWDNPLGTVLPLDSFYCVDGSMAVALDAGGKAHVAFGIASVYFDEGWKVNRNIDGVGYWNEDRPVFSNNVNALNPSGGSGSEMVPDFNLIGWSQDINGDGEITYAENEFGYVTLGISSMVQLVTDNQNRIFLFFTSVTETFDNGIMNYRRLWSRSSLNGGNTWGQFYHFFDDDPATIFNEYAFPSCAARSDEFIDLLVMIDIEPGIYMRPSENQTENFFQYIKIPKDEIVGINQPNHAKDGFDVSQNSPNPFSQSAIVTVNLVKPAPLTLDVMNLLGQKVLQTQTIMGRKGANQITIEKNNLSPGIYFYAVQSSEQTITKKMIID